MSDPQISNPNISVDCLVFRCEKRQEMYLYVREDMPLEELPENLLQLTGNLVEVMGLELDANRKLARVDVTAVITDLKEKGFHLQLPPDPTQVITYH